MSQIEPKNNFNKVNRMSVLLKSALHKDDDEYKKYVIKETMIEIATRILHSCGRKDPVFENNLLDAIEAVDVSSMCEYLDTNSNIYVKTLTNIVYECLKKIEPGDASTIIPAIKSSSILLNDMHEDESANINITTKDASVMLETIFTLVLSVLVPVPQQALTKHVIHDVFDILRLQIIPLTKNRDMCKFCKLR